ncbi:AAA family ATPase [Actinopolymorpha sp. NPDC004070]|uniref:AAA family ATPase n=1 Tax=Actinopolymorpha sp. NPDC004070 TaxID=3154548 RepID=UPI0033AAE1D7
MNDAVNARVKGSLRTMVDFDCPECDADARVQVVAADRITCPECRASRPFRLGRLHVVTGSPATGKSSVGRVLAARSPLELVVLDGDLTARPEHDSTEEAWLGFIDTWLRTAVGVAQGGHSLVLVGYSMPHQWEQQALRHFLGPITYIALVCSDGELDRRLRDRSWMGSRRERASLIELNQTFRARADMTVIETDHRSPEAVAGRILSLVSRHDP